MELRVLAAAAALAAVPPLAAQSPPCPGRAPRDTTPFLACQVDEPPHPDPANAAPRYPDILRASGVGGAVHARFVVDTSGRVEMRSWAVRASSHELFGEAARASVRSWRFAPARRAGVPVRAAYELEVAFEHASDTSLAPVVRWLPAVAPRRAYFRGAERIGVGTPGLARDTLAPPLGAGDVDAVRLASFEAIAAEVDSGVARERPGDPTYGTPVDFCVGLGAPPSRRAAPPPPALLRALRATGRRVHVGAACPRTYDSMIAIVDSLGRSDDGKPPGWRDPYHVVLDAPARWNTGYVVSSATLARGTSTRTYRCLVRRGAAGWQARCGPTRWVVS